MTTIRCALTTPATATPTTLAEVRVDLLDVTEHDAPARPVARSTITDVTVGPAPTDLHLDLDADLDPARDHAVRAVALLAGVRRPAADRPRPPSPGDWTTTTRVPVSATTTDVRLELEPVTG